MLYKIAYARSGMFILSDLAKEEFIKLSPKHNAINNGILDTSKISRHDPLLIEVIDKLGKDASAYQNKLGIMNINSNKYRIDTWYGEHTISEIVDVIYDQAPYITIE